MVNWEPDPRLVVREALLQMLPPRNIENCYRSR